MTKIGGGLSSACQLYGHLKVAMLVAGHQTIFFLLTNRQMEVSTAVIFHMCSFWVAFQRL